MRNTYSRLANIDRLVPYYTVMMVLIRYPAYHTSDYAPFERPLGAWGPRDKPDSVGVITTFSPGDTSEHRWRQDTWTYTS